MQENLYGIVGLSLRGSAAAILVLVFLAASSLIAFTSVSAAYPGSWTSKAPMQVARSRLGVAVVNGKIYAIGGDARSGKWPYVGSFVGTNEEYDPTADMWAFKKSMPTPRCDFAIATYQNKIYCIGGISGIDDTGRRITGVTEVYDPETDKWETKMPMPTARWALQANVVNGKIYLIGGYVPDDSDFGGSISALNEVYDPATDSWTTKAPIPVATSDYPSAVVDNRIYVIGGLSSSPQSDLNQIYDPQTDMWSKGTLMPSGIRYGAAGATTGVNASKRIYFFSGSGTQVYDPINDRWMVGATMPTNRQSLAVAVVNDELYAIGGYTRTYPELYTVGDFITLYATNEQYTPFGYGTPDPSYDGAAPEFSVVSPGNETYFTEGAGLNFTGVALDFVVDEPVFSVRYVLDGGVPVEISGNTTLAELPIGAHNVTVFGFDASGNMGTSETVCFAVAEPEPFPVVLVATASGASAAIIGIALLVYLRRRGHRGERLVKKS
jgi:N-acetylneuraminic acid mutarotase